MEKLNMERHSKRQPPTPAQIRAEQNRQAEADRAQIQANLPAVTPPAQPPAVMEPALGSADEYLARNPSMIVGRPAHPNGKDGAIYFNDDGTKVSPETVRTVITDGIWVGWVRLVEGEPAQYDGGLFFALDWRRRAREELGDLNQAEWPINRFDSGKRDDPWKEAAYIPAEDGASGEMITLQIQTKPGTAAAFATDAFLRHCKQMLKRFPDFYPLVKIGMTPYKSKNFGLQWKPNFQPCGKIERASAAKPDSSIGTDMDDALPF